jgi:hypothetical protein
MFCNACGAPIPSGPACPQCGRYMPAVRYSSYSGRVQRHLRTLGTLWIVAGCIFLIPMVVLFVLSSVVHIAVPPQEHVARILGPIALVAAGCIVALFAALGICVGWGLLGHESWARMAALIMGVLALFHPILGTLLGIYTLWVLLPGECCQEYDVMQKMG